MMDADRSGSLDLAEFVKSVTEIKLDLTDHDTRQLFASFDVNRDGTI